MQKWPSGFPYFKMNSMEEKNLKTGKKNKGILYNHLRNVLFCLKMLTMTKMIKKIHATITTSVYLCFWYCSIHVLRCLRRNV